MEREIVEKDWRTFFDAFRSRPDDWLITVDCDRIGSAFRDLPLSNIVIGDDAIEVFVHAPDGAHVAHIVRRPARIFADETFEGSDTVVTIVNTEGKRTVVQFRAAVPAEQGSLR